MTFVISKLSSKIHHPSCKPPPCRNEVKSAGRKIHQSKETANTERKDAKQDLKKHLHVKCFLPNTLSKATSNDLDHDRKGNAGLTPRNQFAICNLPSSVTTDSALSESFQMAPDKNAHEPTRAERLVKIGDIKNQFI